MKTKITELLGIKYPIIQGGMAWIANHSIASAVSAAGGFGLIAGGNAPADYIREEIKKTREITDKNFGINIMLMSENADDLAQLAIDEKVKAVFTGAGNPGKYIAAWKQAGIIVIPVIPSVAFAKRMESSGADAVVCEGMEAGGHIGSITTMCLTPQVADAVNIPVIAAGGIADGRGVAAAFMLGAQGVQIGTRFLAAAECQIHENYKNLLFKSKDTDSIITGTFTGHPVRSLKNKYARSLLNFERDGGSPEEFEKLTVGSLRKAVVDGNIDEGSFMAGQIAGIVSKEQSALEIIEEIMVEANNLLGKGCNNE